jgi:ATP synthase protein I
MKKKEFKTKKSWIADSSIGMIFPASIAVGFLMGYFLDKLLKTQPYLMIVFTLYGIAAGFVNFVRMTKKK